MRIIFLDVDGVLNTRYSIKMLSLGKSHLRQLQRIIEATKAEIVLSSTWRKSPLAIAKLRKVLMYRNLKIKDVTCTIDSIGATRGAEIQHYLNTHDVDSYVILDDDSDMLPAQFKHFFKTSMDFGLTKDIANAIIDYFRKDSDFSKPQVPLIVKPNPAVHGTSTAKPGYTHTYTPSVPYVNPNKITLGPFD